MFHFKSWLMVKPSNLALVTTSRGLPFRTRGSKSWLLLENPIRGSLHLASFSWNPSRLASLERSSRASWSLLSLPFVTISEQDVNLSRPIKYVPHTDRLNGGVHAHSCIMGN